MKRKKLVTADDYRIDRDYWRRRVRGQQRVIQTLERHKDRLTNDRNACKNSLEYFRNALQEVCTHENTEEYPGGTVFCKLCKASVPN